MLNLFAKVKTNHIIRFNILFELRFVLDAYMEVTNTSAFPVKWRLSSFTPPYFKVNHDKI